MAEFLRSHINNLSHRIIGAAIEVHRHLGPGLLESIYQRCLEQELSTAELSFVAGRRVEVIYKGKLLGCGLRLDLLIENIVIVELKAVDQLAPIHEAQVLSYLKLTGAPLGLLINFNVPVLRDGLRRILNKQHQIVEHLNPESRHR